VYWSILHRMIFWELTRVFLLALVALTGMLVMGGIVAEASQRGLGPMQLLMAIPLLIPSTLPYTLPATTLFATCVVYGRLAHDNEILALKAAGIHLWHVIWPAVLLGVLASVTTVVLSLNLIPTTHHILRTRFVSDVEEFLYSMLKREGCIRHPKIDYTIYVQRVQGHDLLEALFMRRDPKEKDRPPKDQHYDIIAWARKAELRVDLKHKQILVRMHHCYIADDSGLGDSANLDNKEWPIELHPDMLEGNRKSSARAMTWNEILEDIDQKKGEILDIRADAAKHQAKINLGEAPVNWKKHVENQQSAVHRVETQIDFLVTELHMRPALALGCLFFVLVGCPVGIWFSRSDYLSAFITCFLPIVVLYYPLMLCGINLSKLGKINPWIGVWSADLLMAVIALGLFRKLLRN
jgi:lipopolysaccharide export system permease protein